jgi:MFS transporter, DHA2 family, multidrug resistance protein
VPGIIVTAATAALIDFDEPDYSLLKNFDWWGLKKPQAAGAPAEAH